MTEAAPWRPERMRVGTIGRAHGLDGSFRVADPCGWWGFLLGSVVLVDGIAKIVTRSRGDQLAPLINLEGAETRTAIEGLRGAALELLREAIPEPEQGAYFRFDLVGCVVEHADGTPLGTVTAVEDGVAHDVLVIDGKARIPFVGAVVPAVDIPGRRMVLVEGFEVEPVE